MPLRIDGVSQSLLDRRAHQCFGAIGYSRFIHRLTIHATNIRLYCILKWFVNKYFYRFAHKLYKWLISFISEIYVNGLYLWEQILNIILAICQKQQSR